MLPEIVQCCFFDLNSLVMELRSVATALQPTALSPSPSPFSNSRLFNQGASPQSDTYPMRISFPFTEKMKNLNSSRCLSQKPNDAETLFSYLVSIAIYNGFLTVFHWKARLEAPE